MVPWFFHKDNYKGTIKHIFWILSINVFFRFNIGRLINYKPKIVNPWKLHNGKKIGWITTNLSRSDNSIIVCLVANFLGAQKLIYHSCQCHTVFCFDNWYTLRDEINGVVSISFQSCINCPIFSTGQNMPLTLSGVPETKRKIIQFNQIDEMLKIRLSKHV